MFIYFQSKFTLAVIALTATSSENLKKDGLFCEQEAVSGGSGWWMGLDGGLWVSCNLFEAFKYVIKHL